MAELTPANFVMPIALSSVVLFGCIAVGAYFYAVRSGSIKFTTDFFLTARESQPWYRVAWAFYATNMGASVITSIASFVCIGGGYVGLISYALFSGLPLILVAYLGTIIKKQFPEALSIGSYSRWRFGRAFQAWVVFNVLLNLSIALTAEFTAIGSVYENLIGQPAWIPIVVVAIVTMIYTAAGGLYISLFTDFVQSIFLLLLLLVMAIYVAINFRVSLPPGPLPDYLDVNEMGLSSIMTMGVGLTSSILFSDAVWQRVWAAKNDKALMRGSYAGAFLVILMSFCFGFGGFIAAWAGLVNNPNTAFLNLLSVGEDESGEPIVPILMLLVIVWIASVMNEAAVDSFQIAIGDTIISFFESFDIHLDLWSVRAILALMNIPFAIIGCFGLPIINLYLITNLMTTCVMMPLLFGFVPALDNIVTGGAALFGSLFGLTALCFYAVWNAAVESGMPFTGDNVVASFRNGFYYTFYYTWDWPSFMVGLVGSVVGVGMWVAVREGYYRFSGKIKPSPEHLCSSPYAFEKKGQQPVSDEDQQIMQSEKTIAII